MARLGSIIKLVCETEKGPCQFQIEDVSNFQPIDFNPALVARLAAAAEASKLPSMPLVSLAGHDAYMMHHICPTAMLFVPCRGGLTHCEAEWAEPHHIVGGIGVLTDVLASIACD
jgi:N-carbamoyl-L-amino-acid hydrolase